MSQTCSVVAHGLRGLPSNRKLSADIEREAVSILSQPVYRGFGPTLAAEYLAKKLWFSQNPIRLMIPREVGLDLEAGAKCLPHQDRPQLSDRAGQSMLVSVFCSVLRSGLRAPQPARRDVDQSARQQDHRPLR